MRRSSTGPRRWLAPTQNVFPSAALRRGTGAFRVTFVVLSAFVLGTACSQRGGEGSAPPLSQTCGEVTSVASGDAHSCVSCATGKVWCWGDNRQGAVGVEVADAKTEGFADNLEDITTVVAGGTHNCALDKEGNVSCWGKGSPRASKISSLGAGVRALSAEGNQTCALQQDGGVSCWDAGEAPKRISGLEKVTSLATGAEHGCAVIETGAVLCWGSNARGQRGAGELDATIPVGVPDLSDAVEVAAGLEHSCVRRRSGEVRCWGYNARGQLGRETMERDAAIAPVPGLSDASALFASGSRTCAVRAAGELVCWGELERGPLGEAVSLTRPVGIPSLASVKLLGLGPSHLCAVAEGGLFCAGNNAHGQLGAAAKGTSRASPVPYVGLGAWPAGVPEPMTPFEFRTAPEPSPFAGMVKDLDVGDCELCARREGGRVECADAGSYLVGALPVRAAAPVPVGHLQNANSMSVSGCRGCAVLPDGRAQCWGIGNRAGVGDGRDGDSALPMFVSGLSAVAQVSVGQHVCATLQNGEAWCWGDNASFQVSPAVAPIAQPVPVKVPVAAVLEVKAGTDFSCARLSSGEVWCWGSNAGGQLGQRGNGGNPSTASTKNGPTAANGPTRVDGVERAVSLDVGHAHACAVLGTGQVRCWGWNGYGQLGSGNRERVAGSTPVVGLTDVVGVKAGPRHTCALHGSGEVSCWGENAWGELGDGSRELKPSPVKVGGLSGVGSVSVGDGKTCAVKRDGSSVCWGRR